MAKSTGLGDNAYVGGFDLSSNVLSLDNAHGGPNPLDVTPINAFGFARLGGQRDGEINFTTAMDTVAGAEHAALSGLPTTDVILTYVMGLGAAQVIGNPAMCLLGKQVNYDPTRDQAGNLQFKVQAVANGFGIEMNAISLTPGLRTDGAATAAGPANSFDTGASLSFGGQAYLQVTAFAGTSVTASIWDSADNITFAAVSTFAFTAVSAAPASQRIVIANNATIRRYVAVATTGTFSNAVFNVALVKNTLAGQVF
jgi:hypothetical protein